MKINIDNPKRRPLTWRDAKPGDLIVTPEATVLRIEDYEGVIGVDLADGMPVFPEFVMACSRIVPSDDLVLSLREESDR